MSRPPDIIDAEFTVIRNSDALEELPPPQKPPRVSMWRSDLDFIGRLIALIIFAPLLVWLLGRH